MDTWKKVFIAIGCCIAVALIIWGIVELASSKQPAAKSGSQQSKNTSSTKTSSTGTSSAGSTNAYQPPVTTTSTTSATSTATPPAATASTTSTATSTPITATSTTPSAGSTNAYQPPVTTTSTTSTVAAPASSPSSTSTTATTSTAPATTSSQLVPIPVWCKVAELEGISQEKISDVLNTQPVNVKNLSAIADTSKVTLKGTLSVANTEFQLSGTSANKQVSIQLTDPNGLVLQFTGTDKLIDTIQLNATGTDKQASIILGPVQKTNAYSISKQMDGVFIYACKRQQMTFSQVVVIGDVISMRGSDEFGTFILFGRGKVASSGVTIELYKKYDTDLIPNVVYKGSVVKGIASGQWEFIGNADKSEFRLYPKGTVLSEDIPLYGYDCQYATNWKGVLIQNGDPKEYAVTLSNFAVNPNTLVMTGDLNDVFGNSKFTSQLVGRNFKGTKQYDPKLGYPIVSQTGTLSLQILQGTWDNGFVSGTFYYTPA